MADVGNEVGNAENHCPRVALLKPMPVHVQPEIQILWIAYLIRRNEPGANGREGVTAFPLVPLAPAFELVSALGEVIDNSAAGDVFAHPRTYLPGVPITTPSLTSSGRERVNGNGSSVHVLG